MNGQKAKALRKLASYSVTRDRPQLPTGGWISVAAYLDAKGMPVTKRALGTCVLPKTSPRHKYQFLKKRYGVTPLAHTLKRMHRSTALVTELDTRIQQGRV